MRERHCSPRRYLLDTLESVVPENHKNHSGCSEEIKIYVLVFSLAISGHSVKVDVMMLDI